MFRFVIYILVVTIIIFIPLSINTKETEVVHVNKSSSINVSLVEMQKPQTELQKPKPIVNKQKKIVKKVLKKKVLKKKVPAKKIVNPVPITKPEEKAEPKTTQEVVVKKALIQQVNKKTSNITAQKNAKESYYDAIYKQIDSQKRYPKKALRFKQEGDVLVFFLVLANGEISKFKILKPSEFDSLNKEIKNVFKKLRHFSKPPSEIEVPLEIKITIRFKINKE